MYPTTLLKNQFGELSNNYVLGGSNNIALSFVVDATNVNGLGVSSVVGPAVKKVFMHTSATPLAGNPNPAVGYLLIQLAKNYLGFSNVSSQLSSTVSGTPINVTTGVTAGLAYSIITVGTTSISQWQVLGLPVGVTPAVGVAFIATSTTTATGTGTIEVPSATGSGIGGGLELVGDPNVSVAPTDGSGAWILCQFLAATSSSVTTLVKTNPANGTLVNMRISMLDLVQEG